MPKLIKNKCEIEECGESDVSALHLHHIIDRVLVNSSNHPFNLAIVCSNCHNKIHAGKIKIIGVFPSTAPPNGRTLVYSVNGTINVPGIEKPYVEFKPKSFKI